MKGRCIVHEVVPEKRIPYDGAKTFLDSAGRLPPELRTEPRSSDAVRLRRELEKRGLAWTLKPHAVADE